MSGPCGGKTSSLNHMKATLEALKYNVFTIPELPTMLLMNGARYPGLAIENRTECLAFESEIVKFQLQTEDTFRNLAKISNHEPKRPSVVICDRGVLDVGAYVPTELFASVLEELKYDRKDLLQRYDLICHLVTTAEGAEQFYTKSTNAARRESPEEARELDYKTRACWAGHDKLCIIPNSNGGFQQKLEMATKSVVDYLQGL